MPVDRERVEQDIESISQTYVGLNAFLWGTKQFDRIGLNIDDSGKFLLHDYHTNSISTLGDLVHDRMDDIWDELNIPTFDYFLNWISGTRSK